MDENLEWLTQKTEDLKSNKGNFTPPHTHTHTVNVTELQSNKKVTTPHLISTSNPHFQVYSPFLAKNFVSPVVTQFSEGPILL